MLSCDLPVYVLDLDIEVTLHLQGSNTHEFRCYQNEMVDPQDPNP